MNWWQQWKWFYKHNKAHWHFYNWSYNHYSTNYFEIDGKTENHTRIRLGTFEMRRNWIEKL